MSSQPEKQPCRYFASTGNCFYGESCSFAHIRPEGSVASPAAAPSATQKPTKIGIPCRNVALYGFCKFEGKGCEYNHDAPKQSSVATDPRSAAEALPNKMQNLNLKTPSHPPHMKNSANDMYSPVSRGGTTYFLSEDEEQKNLQLQYNPTAGSLPHTTYRQVGRRYIQDFFMNNALRKDLQKRTAAILTTTDPQDARSKTIPSLLHHYNSLCPLDEAGRSLTVAIYGYPTSLYKGISTVDGLPYAIRRIESFRPSNEQALKMAEVWKQVRNPSIVPLAEIFISKDFGDVNSLFFVYHYFPLSETLEARYLTRNANSNSANNELIPEQVMWSFLVQLLSGIRAVHKAGLAVRVILPSKVIITGKNRIRITGCGIHDVVNYDGGKNVTHFQHEDLLLLGHLMLCLACRSTSAVQNIPKSLEFISSHYSMEFKQTLVFLLTKPTSVHSPSVDDVIAMVTPHVMDEADNLYNYGDSLEGELYKEVESGRMFRLLVKLGFVNERPEFDMDPSWSETGDRYLLKLFRDYVFHQTYEDGSPVIDFGHVVECLNKLDAGLNEKIVLMSRDERSLLVVSYSDLKRCFANAFNELMSKRPQATSSRQPPPSIYSRSQSHQPSYHPNSYQYQVPHQQGYGVPHHGHQHSLPPYLGGGGGLPKM